MFRFDDDLRIYLHREPIDFRCGLNTLVTLLEQSMQLDPFARAVFAFHNRKRDCVKLVLYDWAARLVLGIVGIPHCLRTATDGLLQRTALH